MGLEAYQMSLGINRKWAYAVFSFDLYTHQKFLVANNTNYFQLT